MSINQETGLPEVGPKEFWRIRKAATPGYSYMQLRRKILVGSLLVNEEIFSHLYGRNSAAREAAASILNTRMFSEGLAGFYGDYPPRSLS